MTDTAQPTPRTNGAQRPKGEIPARVSFNAWQVTKDYADKLDDTFGIRFNDNDDAVITLSRPLVSHNDNHRQLTLRAPTVGDIRSIGWAYDVEGDNVVPNDERLMKWLMELSGHDEIILEKLHPADYHAIGLLFMHGTNPDPLRLPLLAGASQI